MLSQLYTISRQQLLYRSVNKSHYHFFLVFFTWLNPGMFYVTESTPNLVISLIYYYCILRVTKIDKKKSVWPCPVAIKNKIIPSFLANCCCSSRHFGDSLPLSPCTIKYLMTSTIMLLVVSLPETRTYTCWDYIWYCTCLYQ